MVALLDREGFHIMDLVDPTKSNIFLAYLKQFFSSPSLLLTIYSISK